MKKEIHIEPFDLEETDTICGYNLKNLTLFAMAARKAGVDNEDLARFARNAQNAYDLVRKELDDAFTASWNTCNAFIEKPLSLDESARRTCEEDS